MSKHHNQKSQAKAAVANAGTQSAQGVDVQILEPSANRDQIAGLAYAYWQNRGCPDGSPEEDWFRAEADLRQRTHAAGA